MGEYFSTCTEIAIALYSDSSKYSRNVLGDAVYLSGTMHSSDYKCLALFSSLRQEDVKELDRLAKEKGLPNNLRTAIVASVSNRFNKSTTDKLLELTVAKSVDAPEFKANTFLLLQDVLRLQNIEEQYNDLLEEVKVLRNQTTFEGKIDMEPEVSKVEDTVYADIVSDIFGEDTKVIGNNGVSEKVDDTDIFSEVDTEESKPEVSAVFKTEGLHTQSKKKSKSKHSKKAMLEASLKKGNGVSEPERLLREALNVEMQQEEISEEEIDDIGETSVTEVDDFIEEEDYSSVEYANATVTIPKFVEKPTELMQYLYENNVPAQAYMLKKVNAEVGEDFVMSEIDSKYVNTGLMVGARLINPVDNKQYLVMRGILYKSMTGKDKYGVLLNKPVMFIRAQDGVVCGTPKLTLINQALGDRAVMSGGRLALQDNYFFPSLYQVVNCVWGMNKGGRESIACWEVTGINESLVVAKSKRLLNMSVSNIKNGNLEDYIDIKR